MSKPAPQALAPEIAVLRRQLLWAETSLLQLVQAVEYLDRSVHQFEATHPATISDQLQMLLHQIRQSHPGPLPAPRPAPTPEPPQRRHIKQRKPKPPPAA